jgi:hypothetical protein
MDERTPCPTVLLDDQPASRDEFGSHERVADAVYDMVAREQGGRTVALIGDWGTGKSTVLRLLQAKARRGDPSPVDVQMVEFDAWAHQGDPLRRTFIEHMIVCLSSYGWIRAEEWEDAKLALSRRKRTEEKIETAKLTEQAKILLICSLLAPLGLVGVSKTWGDGVTVLGAISFVLATAVFSGFAYLLAARWRRFWPFAGKRPEGAEAAESLVAILANKSQVHTISATTETPDPTSIEFQELFRDVLVDALGSMGPGDPRSRRRLLLAIDNLDRVCAAEGLALWADMRAFFTMSLTTCDWLSRLWVIVPYDHSGLARLWETGRQDRGALAEPFIQKTFQVRFHVPRPVASDWHQLMHDALARALPRHGADDRHAVYRVYRVYSLIRPRQTDNGSPTPRDIKMFVNDLGAVHRQWCGAGIPLADQALFVLMARDGASAVDELRKKESILSDARLTVLTSAMAKHNLAAMCFNLPPVRAYQALLKPEAERYLTEGNWGMLSEVSAYDGFADVCQQVIEDGIADWTAGEVRNIAAAAAAMAGMPHPPEGDASWRTAWERLCQAARGCEHWDVADELVVEGLTRLMAHDPADSLAVAVLKGACNVPD